MLTKSNLNHLQGITQERTHLRLKTTGYHVKSISNFEGQYLTFPYNKNNQILTNTKLLFAILEVINFSTVDKLGGRYLTLFTIG